MRRGEIAAAEDLIPGDRFYRLKDKSKTALEWDHYKAKGKYVIAWTINARNEFQKPMTIPIAEKVVFLRNTADKYAEDIRKITHQQADKGNTDSAL